MMSRNKIIVLGIIAFIVIIGFVLSACVEECLHAWGSDVITAPTCTEGGYTTQTCSSCLGTQKINLIPKTATGHNWSGDIVIKPTCTDGGYTTQKCLNCHETQKINQTSAQHNWKEWNVINSNAPTCATTGLGTRNCSICNYLDPSSTIPALGHDYGDWELTLAPTCLNDGYEARACNKIGVTHYETRNIVKLGHDWSGGWSGITKTCQRNICNVTHTKHEMVSIPSGNLVWDVQKFFTDSWGNTSPSGRENIVILLNTFKMGKYQVTQEQYKAVMGNNPSYFQGSSRVPTTGEEQSKRPVDNVSWYDAIDFCNKLSEIEGLTPVYTRTGNTIIPNWSANGYRLPTEAQWEYASKADANNFPFGTSNEIKINIINYTWCNENSSSRTHQVGLKLPNGWELYDMHGNVWEWCWDWWYSYENPPTTNQENYAGPSSGTERVRRGGGFSDPIDPVYIYLFKSSSWSNYFFYSKNSTNSCRTPNTKLSDTGFRVVLP